MSNNSRKTKQIVLIASVGGGLEIYDFTIYVFFAPVLAKLFFPNSSAFSSLLNTFAVFAVGYIARPLGAIVFGHFGDKIGRKKGLLISIVLMAVSTTLMGCLPTYETMGIFAPLLLVILRFLQGIAVGGDLPGAITFIAEYAENHRRGFLCSLIYCGVNIGLLLACFVSVLVNGLLEPEQVSNWGWRLAFMLGIVIGFVGLYLRRKISDTPYFQKIEHLQAQPKMPFFELLSSHRGAVLKGILLCWMLAVVVTQLFLYMPTYLHTVIHMDLNQALLMNSINLMILSLAVPVAGLLSDLLGRKKIIVAVTILFILLSYPLYGLLSIPNFFVQQLALSGFAILSAGYIGVLPSVLSELFQTPIRYSGVGVSYNISFAVFASLTPIVANLLSLYLGFPAAPSFNLIFCSAIAFFTSFFIRETRGKPLILIDSE